MFEELMTLAKNEMRAPELILYLLKNRILMHLRQLPYPRSCRGCPCLRWGLSSIICPLGYFRKFEGRGREDEKMQEGDGNEGKTLDMHFGG